MFAQLLCGLRFGAALLTVLPALAGPPAAAPLPADPHPLRFTPNHGQWETPVLFAANVPAGRLFLERNRLVVARYDARVADEMHHRGRASGPARIPAHAYAVTFVGANARPALTGEAPTGERSNYFLGNDTSRWATAVPAFTDVRYRALYPGIDLRFYGRGKVLEYDFELAAGADAGKIALRYDGQQSLRVVAGNLQIGTRVGRVTEQRPVAYQLRDGRRQPVPCRYVLGPGRTVRFGLGAYDHRQPLVIDPVLVYSSYSGASASLNWGYSACPDSLGNLYAASINFTAGYPTTLGAYDASFNGAPTDIVISKYNPNAATGASSLLYATYLGGSAEDYPHSLVVNRANELVLLGSTASPNFPTTAGAYDRSFNGGTSDLVVSRLSADGRQLLGSTFVGGTGADGRLTTTTNLYNNFGDDFRGDITTDRQNNVYFASVTRSTNFPTSGGLPFRGGHEAVVVKLNPTLTALGWSTLLSGTGDEAAYSIALDSLGRDVYVAGGTTSPAFPGTAGGLNPTYRGGPADGFITRLQQNLTSAGVAVLQSTYLGTSSYDQAYFLQLDRRGAVYALGQTNGTYPVSAGAYSNAGSRQFIHKLSADLTSTGFSTVFGNGPQAGSAAQQYPTNLAPTAFLVDNCGQILLSGYGASSIAGMPTTPDALQPTAPNRTVSGDPNLNTFGYLYLMQLSANARQLVYGSYFGTGTTHVDGGTSRFDKQGVIYQAICVRSEPNGGGQAPPIRTTPNALARTQLAGVGTTSAAFKLGLKALDASFVPAANNVPGTRSGCAPLTVTFTRPTPGTSTTAWDFGNGQTSTQANNVTATYPTPGTYTVRLTVSDNTGCLPSVSTTDQIVVSGPPRPNAGLDRALCPGGSATLSVAAAPNTTYTWTPATGLNTTTGPTVVATPAVTTQYIVTASTLGTGCTNADTVVVSVSSQLAISIPAPSSQCAGATATLTATDAGPGATYTWTPATGLSATTGRTVTATPAATTTYTVAVTAGTGCTGTATVTVAVTPAPAPALGPDQTICAGASATLSVVAAPNTTYAWTPATGLSATTGPSVTATPTATTAYTLTATTAAGCTATATTTVRVDPVPALAFRINPTQVLVGEPATFGISGTLTVPITTLMWDFGDGGTGRGLSLSHSYAAPGVYTVRLNATSAGGCPGSSSGTVTVVAPTRDQAQPNIITPNGDKLNDTFQPYLTAAPVTLQIFNRWGRRVFEQADYQGTWGDGADVAPGTYFYRLSTADGQSWKGWVEVMR